MKKLILTLMFFSSITMAMSLEKTQGDSKFQGLIKRELKSYGKNFVDTNSLEVIPLEKVVNRIIQIESGFSPDKKREEKIVKDYSYGLMQIRCDTAKSLGFKGNCNQLLQPETNLRYGIKYLNIQMKRYDYRLDKVVSAYNNGTAIICQSGRTTSGKLCQPGKYVNQSYVDIFYKSF